MLKEGKKSKLGFPELGLVVKSKMLDKKTQVWLCPVEGCIEAYKTSHSCDSHVNIHMKSIEEKCGRKHKAPSSVAVGSSVEKK